MSLEQKDLEAELELSLLQINQLQEELEYYYTKSKEATNNQVSREGLDSGLLARLRLLRNARLTDEVYQGSSEASVNASLIRRLENAETENQSLKSDGIQVAALKNDKQNLQDQLQRIQALVTELEGRNTELVKKITELEDLLSESGRGLAVRDNEILEVKTELMNARKEIKTLHEQSVSLQAAVDFLSSEKSGLNEQLEDLRSELREKDRSVSLGQKVLAKTQSDLDNLRDSFADKVTAEKELVDLVKELREKLTLASKYYLKFQQDHPELLAAQADLLDQG